MTIFVPVFLALFLVAPILVIRFIYLRASKKRGEARTTAIVLSAIVGGYTTVLLGASLISKPQNLSLSEVKCFDDWCVTVDSWARQADRLSVRLATVNHGRRAQAPDSPHAFVVADGQMIPVLIPKLTDKIEGGSTNPIHVTGSIPPAARRLEFLVTEGGGPSMLVIDER